MCFMLCHSHCRWLCYNCETQLNAPRRQRWRPGSEDTVVSLKKRSLCNTTQRTKAASVKTGVRRHREKNKTLFTRTEKYRFGIYIPPLKRWKPFRRYHDPSNHKTLLCENTSLYTYYQNLTLWKPRWAPPAFCFLVPLNPIRTKLGYIPRNRISFGKICRITKTKLVACRRCSWNLAFATSRINVKTDRSVNFL